MKKLARRGRLIVAILFTVLLTVLAAAATAAIKSADGVTAGNTSSRSFRCSAHGASATNHAAVAQFDLNDYGDTSAIQNAIDVAGQQGGGIVALPAGTFVIDSSLVLRNNVELTGVGPATVIKAGPGLLSAQGPGGGYPLITTAGASNTTVADLTADQSGDTLDGNLPARLAGYVVEGRDSRNVLVDHVYVRNPFTYSIAMVETSDFCIEDCNTQAATSAKYNQLDGIHILDSSSGQVIDNVVQSGDDGLVAHTIWAPVHNIIYADNKVYGGRAAGGLQLAVGDFPIYNIQIVDNSFYGSLYGVHTGYYGTSSGSVYDISIFENYIHDLSQGQRSPAIEINGLGPSGSIDDVTVNNNRICRAGAVVVQKGPGNTVAGTTGC